MSGNPHRLAEAANNISNHLNEAPKTSPQEDEFLTDLTKAQIAAISPLMKSKDWNRLKAYLVSQKMVDKDFNDIKGYRMDRDVLSVLQRSFKDYHEQTENNIRNGLAEAGTRVSGQPLHWWQVMNTHCGWTQPMSDMEVQKKTGVKPVFNRAMGKAMTEFVVKLTDGKTGPIIHAVIYQEQDGNTKGWDVAAHSSGQAQSAVISQVKAMMKQMGMPCNGKRPMTSKQIMSGEGVESGEGVTEARTNNTGTPTPVRLGKGRPAGAMTPAALFMHKFDQLEDDNAHGAAALLLAKFMGNSKAVKCIELVNKIHEIEGSIPHLIQQYRDRWSERLWADFAKKYPNERFQ